MARISAALGLSLVLVGSQYKPVCADNAPKQLHGKSVVVAWPEERMQRDVGQPSFYPVKAAHNLSVYVSTAGRVFNRMTENLESSHRQLEEAVTTLKTTQGQLIQSEKLSAIGEFVRDENAPTCFQKIFLLREKLIASQDGFAA